MVITGASGKEQEGSSTHRKAQPRGQRGLELRMQVPAWGKRSREEESGLTRASHGRLPAGNGRTRLVFYISVCRRVGRGAGLDWRQTKSLSALNKTR